MSGEISLDFTCSENSLSCSVTSARLFFNVSLNIEIKIYQNWLKRDRKWTTFDLKDNKCIKLYKMFGLSTFVSRS